MTDNAADNEAELVTDDNLLYYLPPAGEKDEESASQSMNEDVGTGASDKQHHRGGLCLIERQLKKKKKAPCGHLCVAFYSLFTCRCLCQRTEILMTKIPLKKLMGIFIMTPEIDLK